MVDYILKEIIGIYEAISNVGMDSNLTTSLESFNSTVYTGIKLIRTNVIAPVAYVILSLFLLLELQNIVTRVEGIQGTLGAELPIKALFKVLICKTIIDNVGLITSAFYEVSLHLIKETQAVLGLTSMAGLSPNIVALRRVIEDYSILARFSLSAKISIISILVTLILLAVKVIIVARFFQIFIYIAISPIPVATLPHSEMSSIAKNFFKNFAAACLHGVLIYIILAIFPLLVKGAVLGAIDGTGDLYADLWKILGYSFILGISVTASGKWAKSICNAM